MIRQDYIIRMIQEIFAAIANLLLRRKRISQTDWEEYESTARQILGVPPEQLAQMECKELLDQYHEDKDGIEKIELAAMMMLKMAEDTKDIVPPATRRSGPAEVRASARKHLLPASRTAHPVSGIQTLTRIHPT